MRAREHTVAAGLRALEIASERLWDTQLHEVSKAINKGRRPHVEATIKCDRAHYLYRQGQSAIIAIRAMMGLPRKLRLDAAMLRQTHGDPESASARAQLIENIAQEIESYFGETRP